MKKNKFFLYLGLTLLTLVWIVPLLTILLTALKSRQDFYTQQALFSLPETLQWSNFKSAWTSGSLGVYMKNGLIVCCVKVPIGLVCSSMCAFALSRLKIRHSNGIFIFILVGMMLPSQMALIPLNRLYSKLGLTNTYFCLWLTYIGFGIPTGTLVLRGFMRGIPKEIDEACYIDGCNKWKTYLHVILPISKPAIATVVIMDFLYTWNEFVLQSVFITTDTMKTVPNGLLSFIGEYTTDYGLLNSGVLISIVPVLVVYLIFQRYFVEGMAGAVKA